jgi:hypothetical protein
MLGDFHSETYGLIETSESLDELRKSLQQFLLNDAELFLYEVSEDKLPASELEPRLWVESFLRSHK